MLSKVTLAGLLLTLLVYSVGLANPPSAPPAKSGTIEFSISNLQNIGKGQLVLYLFKKVDRVEVAKDLPYFKRKAIPVSSATMTARFTHIPYGEYAILVLHDMDRDYELDTTFIGIPDEDLGISNNVKGGPLGGPKGAEAKVPHTQNKTVLDTLTMKHFYD